MWNENEFVTKNVLGQGTTRGLNLSNVLRALFRKLDTHTQ